MKKVLPLAAIAATTLMQPVMQIINMPGFGFKNYIAKRSAINVLMPTVVTICRKARR